MSRAHTKALLSWCVFSCRHWRISTIIRRFCFPFFRLREREREIQTQRESEIESIIDRFVQLQDNGCFDLSLSLSAKFSCVPKHFVFVCTFTVSSFVSISIIVFVSVTHFDLCSTPMFFIFLKIYFIVVDRWNKRLFMIEDDYDIKCIILNEKQAKQTPK